MTKNTWKNPERNAGYRIMMNLTPPQLREATEAEFRRWIETRTDEYREMLVRGQQEADQELAEYTEAEFRRWIETRTDEYREMLVRGQQEADQELAEYLERHKELRARIEREKQRTQ